MQTGDPGFSFRSFFRCTAIFALLLLLGYGAQALQLGQETSSPTERVVHVHGIVLNALTEMPIGRALVTAREAAAMTNGDGRFDFNLKFPPPSAAGGSIPGLGGRGTGGREIRVAVMARRPGYLPMERPSMLTLPGKGSDDPELQIKLTPESILRGHVVTPAIASPMGVQVLLLRKQIQDGLASWVQATAALTNSRGEYRFSDLPAGNYKVMTREWVQNGALPGPGNQITGYPPTYYPNEPDIESGTPIHIGRGETAQADLILHAEPYYRVNIPVMNVVAGNGISVGVSAARENKSVSPGFSLGFNPQSQMIEGYLPNGAYSLRVTSFGVVQSGATGRIDVAGGPVRGSPISLTSGGSIAVIVREEFTADTGGGPAKGVIMNRGGNGPSRSLNLVLQPDQANGPGASLRPPLGKGSDDLVVENVWEGKYRLSVMPFRGYVASATSHGVDLLRNMLVVGPGGTSAPIEITLRDDTAWLDGTVSVDGSGGDDQGPYGPNFFVFCVPIGHSNGGMVPMAGAMNGKFTFRNLAPGQYLVLASRTFNPQFEYRNEEVLRQYESKGAMLTLTPGQKAEITVSKVMEDDE
jgi:hypothetical protein